MLRLRTLLLLGLVTMTLSTSASAQVLRGGILRRIFNRETPEDAGDAKSERKKTDKEKAEKEEPRDADSNKSRKQDLASVAKNQRADSKIELNRAPELPRDAFGITLDLVAEEKGVRVAGLQKGSDGDLAGLQVDDRIVEIGGTPVDSLSMFDGFTDLLQPGDRLLLKVIRGGDERELNLVHRSLDAEQVPLESSADAATSAPILTPDPEFAPLEFESPESAVTKTGDIARSILDSSPIEEITQPETLSLEAPTERGDASASDPRTSSERIEILLQLVRSQQALIDEQAALIKQLRQESSGRASF